MSIPFDRTPTCERHGHGQWHVHVNLLVSDFVVVKVKLNKNQEI